MQQFVVKKANRLGEESWSTRVLTIDPVHHVLYLSQHGDVNQLDHHCMVRITKVRWWPYYSWFLHSTAYGICDAPCTFCVEGATIQHGEASSIVSTLFHLNKRRMTEAEFESYTSSVEQLAKDRGVAGEVEMPRGQRPSVARADTWMLRCMTREDIVPLQAAFRNGVADLTSVKADPCISMAQVGW